MTGRKIWQHKEYLHFVFSAGCLEYLTIVKFLPYLIIIISIKVYYLIGNLSMLSKETNIECGSLLVF